MRCTYFSLKFLFTGFCLFLLTCNVDKSPSENSYLKIIVPENNLNDFSNQLTFKSITKLETKPESIFRDPTKVLVNNHILFVYDRSLQKILLFDKNGIFVGKLDQKGRGPNEYIDLRDFQITSDKLIAILTYDKVMYYDFNFHLVNIYKIGIKNDQNYYLNPTHFYQINDTYYLWNGTIGIDYNKEKMPFLMYSGRNGKIINGYFPLAHKLIGSNRFSAFNNRVLITPTIHNDTIYSIDNGKLEIAFKIDFGKYNLPKGYINVYEDMQKLFSSDYCTNISNLMETKEYLYFEYVQRKRMMQGLFSKTTGKCVTGILTPFTKMICVDDDSMIEIVDQILLEDCVRSIDKFNISPEIKEVFRKMSFNVDDNPLKIEYSIKPF